jgi:uncharacterized protein
MSALTFSLSDDTGKHLENMVYIELYRRYGSEIYFLQDQSETDFVVLDRSQISLYQVCSTLTDDNRSREIRGCIDGMHRMSVAESYIITLDQREEMQEGDMSIHVVPWYQWIYETDKK